MSIPPQYDLGTVMPAPPRRRRTRLIVGVAVAVLAAAGLTTVAVLIVGSEREKPDAVAATSAAPGPTVDQATVVECTNVARAYKAWLGLDMPSTVGEVQGMNAFRIQGLMEDGEQLFSQVEGYTDQPSKALAVAVAEYNLALSTANVYVTIGDGDGMSAEQANDVVRTMNTVQSSYSTFRSTTCSAVT